MLGVAYVPSGLTQAEKHESRGKKMPSSDPINVQCRNFMTKNCCVCPSCTLHTLPRDYSDDDVREWQQYLFTVESAVGILQERFENRVTF
jgi:hypothetical protein